MKNVIYFFSATGNSLKVSKELAKHLENIELVQIHQDRLDHFDKCLRTDADHIGFICPTIFSGIPLLVHRFIHQLEISHPSPYIYAIATHGDANGSGIVFEEISSILKGKILILSASFSIQMPHSAPEQGHLTTQNKKNNYLKKQM